MLFKENVYRYIMSFFNVTIWLPVDVLCVCECVCVRAVLCVCVCKRRNDYRCVRPVSVLPMSFLYLFVSWSKKKKATIKSLILIKPSCCWRCSRLAHKRPHSVPPNLDSQTFFIGLQVVWKQHYCSGRADRSYGIFLFFAIRLLFS